MPTDRRLPKRSVAKDGNKSKKPRRGGKAGSGTKEGRVSVAPTVDTAAATVALPEMAAAETEAVAVPETVEAEKEGSLAAVSEVVEKERERRLVSETVVVDKEVDAGAFMIFCGAVFFLSVCYTAYKLYNHFI